MRNQSQQQMIAKRLIPLIAIDSIALLFVGLAIYAKINGPDQVFHPLLANEALVNIVLGFSCATLFWCIVKIYQTVRDLALVGRS